MINCEYCKNVSTSNQVCTECGEPLVDNPNTDSWENNCMEHYDGDPDSETMKFAKYDQERFEKLDPQVQEFLMNDFEPIRVQDQYNDSKIHYFKRENGKLLYLQTVENKAFTRTRSDGREFHRYASESIYTRSDVDTYGWTNASDEDGLLIHGHGHWLLWFFEEMVNEAGDRVSVYRNQANRSGRVMATDFDTRKSLIKYTMPRGAIYMNVISWTGEEAEYWTYNDYYRDWHTGQWVDRPVQYQAAPQTYKAVSEKALSKKWKELRLAQTGSTCVYH